MGRTSRAPIGHEPTPDPTDTFCIVEGCRRYLGRVNKTEHRRGSSGRAPTPIEVWPEGHFQSSPIAALEERVELQGQEITRLREDVNRLLAAALPSQQLVMGSWRDNKPGRDGQTRP